VRVLLWHGYLLSGSGSNVYTANLAEKWRAAGHDVLLLCQERRAERFLFVDEHAELGSGDIEWVSLGAPRSAGRCRLARPDIHDFLPVYVYDEYEGFEVKTFVDLSDEELTRYTHANVAAMERAIELHRPEAIITGHEVMGPAIARRACEPTNSSYLAKLHGSGLEFAVKKQERYRDHAIDGLQAARVVVGGSRYMIEEAASVIPGFGDRAVVVNPGCDIDLFRPVERRSAEFTVGYVGKLIEEKGVHHLLNAIDLMQEPPRVVVVGYGGFESELRELANGLHARIEFTGRLDHVELAPVLPTFDVLVAPSVIPEAFGLVIAEAAACGVLPIAPAHSGIGEAARTLEEHLGRPGLLTFDPDDPIRGIASAVDRIRALTQGERRDLGSKAAALAAERWSWTTVAERLLDLATAEH
jgi:glycosyltransferase involved in cell wall biosynthesis